MSDNVQIIKSVKNKESDWDNNVANTPEKSGLEIFLQLDEANLYYEYNTLIIFKHSLTGKLFIVTDSGCSCPTPFEYYYFNFDQNKNIIDTNMEEVRRENVDGAILEIKEFPVKQEENMKAREKLQKYEFSK